MKENENVRIFLNRLRKNDGGFGGELDKKNSEKKAPTTKDLLKITRKLNEEFENDKKNIATDFDRTREEQKFKNYFNDLNVSIVFIPLEVYQDFAFWGGTIDGIIQFMYSVTKDETTSGVDFNYLDGFSPENEGNDEIINRIKLYYDIFYKYWRDNALQA